MLRRMRTKFSDEEIVEVVDNEVGDDADDNNKAVDDADVDNDKHDDDI